MTATQSEKWRGIVSIARSFVPLSALIGVILAAACGGEERPIPASITSDEASRQLVRLMASVEEPDADTQLAAATLKAYSAVLINGSAGLAPEGEEVPGLSEARQGLENGDLPGFCSAVGSILRGSLVNRLMSPRAKYAVTVTPNEMAAHDPRGVFLGRSGQLRGMGNGRSLNREALAIEGDVVSAPWKDATFGLMDIIYGLGQDCIDAAREDSS